jgi:tight adherence protein C
VVNVIALIIVGATAVLAYRALVAWRVRQRALRRLYAEDDDGVVLGLEGTTRDTRLSRWLARAGYRDAGASTIFIWITIGFIAGGAAIAQAYRLLFAQSLLDMVASAPGGAGDVLVFVLQAGPLILFGLCAFVPTLYVRAVRRARMRAIEEDLPLALELLATMAEAGLGFDAALSRIVKSQGSDRPLVTEFVNFQHDMLAGMSRTQALRQLARRVDAPSLSSFTSALIQAEQVGASMAETLQHQAVDLRQRRRESALLQAQALPVKLVFPLVVCFLPGIFASTLAPVLFQMVEVANSVLRSGR